ncbi:MAG TPA: hypothetical protein VGO00_07665 [Kofleriaceae bacterium]|jgi:hypothetical protein|nr:hypothetical protein [Kofleriaceae bacterium]
MRRGTAIAVIASACGRLDFGIIARDAGSDAPVDACTLSPFGDVHAVTELDSSVTDFGGQISPDGLTYYFDSFRGTSDDLYVAHRTNRSDSFDSPQPITELDTADAESDPTVTGDELEMVFSSNRNAERCLYDTRRASTADPWGAPKVWQTLCTGGLGGSFISIDGLTLVYNTLDDGVGEGKLVIAHRTSRADDFVTGTMISELAPGSTKGYPALSSDELTIYYESTGDGTHLQVWQATRASVDAPFGSPQLVPGVDDGDMSNEGDASITADGLELYFASDRTGDNDIYVATRACL